MAKMPITVLGIDLGKNSCSVAGLDINGAVVLLRHFTTLTGHQHMSCAWCPGFHSHRPLKTDEAVGDIGMVVPRDGLPGSQVSTTARMSCLPSPFPIPRPQPNFSAPSTVPSYWPPLMPVHPRPETLPW
jgi:hypothetical protein